MQERKIREVQEEDRIFETPVHIELGSIEDLTQYDVSVIIS